jgi:hypothetical protein
MAGSPKSLYPNPEVVNFCTISSACLSRRGEKRRGRSYRPGLLLIFAFLVCNGTNETTHIDRVLVVI